MSKWDWMRMAEQQRAAEEADQDLERLLGYLRDARGFDFSGYKRASLGRRITKRVQAVGADGYAGYQEFLEAEPLEFVDLFNTILINVTAFNRDPEAWTYLSEQIVPRLIDAKGDDEPVRAWSAGCSS